MSAVVGSTSTGLSGELTPVAPQARIVTLDVLRGVAVFGIILSDIDSVIRDMEAAGDRVAVTLYSFLVWDRFFPLFAFLFGLGFALQMLRAEARGAPFVWTYLRRLVVLFSFGAANVIFLSQIWRGDVLHRYALLGLVLLLFRRWSPRAILVAVMVCFLVPTAREVIVARNLARQGTGVQQAPAQPPTAQPAGRGRELRRLQSEGSYAEVTVFAAQRFLRGLMRWQSYVEWIGKTFPLFLLGLYVGRRRILDSVDGQLPFIRKVLWWALGLGLVGSLLTVFPFEAASAASSDMSVVLGRVLERMGGPAMSLFYASSIVLLWQHSRWKAWLTPFSPVGRTALSNYLFQAGALALLSPGYGLGLHGKLTPIAGAALACAIFVAELWLSNWWMRRFRSGPAEWLWRSATYWSWQPMRVQREKAPTISHRRIASAR